MKRPPGFWTVGRIALILGLVAWLLVVLTLGDPGITIDEPLDVRPGRTYVETLRAKGWRFFSDPAVIDHVFADNAEHPPLGRWLLGVASILGEPFAPWLGGADAFGVRAARLAPATCFGVLVGLVSLAGGRRYGKAAGAAAGASLVLMPRVFAHAHFGALDTFLALFWTAALLAAVTAAERLRPIRTMAWAGAVWSLALLTKIHAWLLPPIVFAWLLLSLPWRKALGAMLVWGFAGFLLYFAGWPWLWRDPVGRLGRYLGTGVHRLTLYVEYFGKIYADRDVPWHYPWVYFVVTVPLGLHLLGSLGLIEGFRRRRVDPFPLLLAGAIGLFLVVFSTNVPVYDGERLFLVAFPLWAILIGLGFGMLWKLAEGRRWARIGLTAFLLAQAYSVVTMHPFGLSYYNELIGGLPGAERRGMELTYWGDAVDPVLLDELAQHGRLGETAALAPTLHHQQGIASTTPELYKKGLWLSDESDAGRTDWVVVYRRRAYWKPGIEELTRTPPAFVRQRSGVWLSGLWRRPPPPAFRKN